MRSTPAPAVALTSFLAACAEQAVMLNSERIDQRFGNYGIELLPSEHGVRRSNLFSEDGGVATCRTYAVVEFAEQIDERFAATHEKIRAGGSIGATLRDEGWEILKQTLFIGQVALLEEPREIRQLMHLDGHHEIALHAYRLVVADGDVELAYATILEAHHPDYLDAQTVQDIYGWKPRDDERHAQLTKFTDLLFYR